MTGEWQRNGSFLLSWHPEGTSQPIPRLTDLSTEEERPWQPRGSRSHGRSGAQIRNVEEGPVPCALFQDCVLL